MNICGGMNICTYSFLLRSFPSNNHQQLYLEVRLCTQSHVSTWLIFPAVPPALPGVAGQERDFSLFSCETRGEETLWCLSAVSLANGHPLLHAVAVDSKKPAPKRRTASAWETGGQSSCHVIISMATAGKIRHRTQWRVWWENMGKPWGKEVKLIYSWWIMVDFPAARSFPTQKDDLGLLGFFRTWKWLLLVYPAKPAKMKLLVKIGADALEVRCHAPKIPKLKPMESQA